MSQARRSSSAVRSGARRVLEAELEDQAAGVGLRIVILEPFAPSTEREAIKRGVIFVPIRDQLPEVVWPQVPHLVRSVRLQLTDKVPEGDPPRRRKLLWDSGREIAHHMRCKDLTPGKPAAELSDSPRGVVDEWGHVSTAECVEWATKVTQTESIMVGPSAGAAIKYACDVACRPEAAGKTIVVMVGSHGIRYVQHPLWAKIEDEGRGRQGSALVAMQRQGCAHPAVGLRCPALDPSPRGN